LEVAMSCIQMIYIGASWMIVYSFIQVLYPA
jgi:hypothetical protein